MEACLRNNIIVRNLEMTTSKEIYRNYKSTRYRYSREYQTFQTSHPELSRCSFHQRSRPSGTNLHDISFRVLTSFRWILRLSWIRFLYNDNEWSAQTVSVLRQIKIFIATKVTVILRERALTNHSANVVITYATFLRKSKFIL